MTASPPPAGPRTQEIAVPPAGSAPADPAAHGATAVGTAPEHPPHAAPAPLPPPAYPHTAPQPVHAEAATAVVPPAGTGATAPPQPTGPLDSFFGTPPPPPPPAAPAEAPAAPAAEAPPRRTARAPRTPRDRAVLITTGLGVVGLVLLELGLALRLGGQVLWSDLPLWSAFATLAALSGVVGLAASLLSGGRLRPAVAERLAVGGLAGLAVFWVLIALPRVDSDRGFLLTAALGALAVAVWLAPARRRG
ncbi:hypothetical protein ACI780_18445 [Geodermatophilus sp. SYSU D00814]